MTSQIRDVEHIESVPQVGNTSSEENECIICYKGMLNGRTVAPLDCDHEFHEKCLAQWFQVKKNCPICRTDPPNADIIEAKEDSIQPEFDSDIDSDNSIEADLADLEGQTEQLQHYANVNSNVNTNANRSLINRVFCPRERQNHSDNNNDNNRCAKIFCAALGIFFLVIFCIGASEKKNGH